MRRIGIDCRFAETNSGLGRYTRALVTRLLRRNDTIEYVLFVRSSRESWIPEQSAQCIPVYAPHYSFAEHISLSRLIKQTNLDLFFTPHFNAPLRCPVPLIITVHDLILHKYPNRAPYLKQIAYRLLLRHALSNASHIIAVSRFTQNEIHAAYGSDIAQKTSVIPEGVEPHFRRQSQKEQMRVREKYGLPSPFFLYIGNAKEHKNVQTLIDAAARFPRKTLVLVTQGKEIHRLRPAQNTVILSSVEERDLPALYSAADSFVTASLYEGFCLPIAEAQACGCAVIASKCGAIPEVVSPTARLVDPTTEALAQAMQNPPAPSQTLPHSTWEKAAAKTAEIFLHYS